MQIVNENTKFEEILPGEVFKYHNVYHNEYYIKTKATNTKDASIVNYCNAIMLSTGAYAYFDDSTEVSAVKCKLVIED